MIISLHRLREKVAEKLIFINIIQGFPEIKVVPFWIIFRVARVNEDTPIWMYEVFFKNNQM